MDPFSESLSVPKRCFLATCIWMFNFTFIWKVCSVTHKLSRWSSFALVWCWASFFICKHLPVLKMQFAPNKNVLVHFNWAVAPQCHDLMHNNTEMFIDNFCWLGRKNSFNRLTLLYLQLAGQVTDVSKHNVSMCERYSCFCCASAPAHKKSLQRSAQCKLNAEYVNLINGSHF